jgi:hypothetical protein
MPQPARVQKWLGDWRVAVLVCVALLLLRSWFFLAWEESYFDSDQAIVGLMAKHLAEGRAKPLFFYGQEYMLAVEAWVSAPFIALFGTSVVALRTALVALNLATGLLLLRLLVTDAGLGIWSAVAASSIFWIAPIVPAANLVEAQGGNIEPFLWVLILWILRRRPLALGACLAIAFMNREFSIYAAPMLVLVHMIETRCAFRLVALDWTMTAVSFLVVFTAVQLLKPHADLLGPGTAGASVATLGQDTIALVVQRVHWNPSELASRFSALATDYLPTMFGFKHVAPMNAAIVTEVRVGWDMAAPLVTGLAIVGLILLAVDARRVVRGPNRWWLFPIYLTGIGVIAAIAYAVTRPLDIATVRYGLLVLYAPVGLAALMLHSSRRAAARAIGAACLVIFAVCSTIDHARVLAGAAKAPPRTPMRQVLTRLEQRGVEVAVADYWRAYLITFLSGEKIKVAAVDFERIKEYNALANRLTGGTRPGRVVSIQADPCAVGGERVAGWYLCDR